MDKPNTPCFDKIDPRQCVNGKARRLHKMLDGIYQEGLRPFGLKGSMLSILFIIGKRKGINQKTIANTLVLDQSTVSRDLKKLLNKNWIQINKGKDPRNSELEISKAGYQLLEEVTPVWNTIHTKIDALLGQFNIQQLDNISEIIKTVKIK